jgi:hypothetical protein
LSEKIPRPRGIFPSLPGGIDIVLKRYFDAHRSSGRLPKLLDGVVPGRLIDSLPRRLSYYDEEIGAELSGLLDDCLDLGNGTYAALDNKTRGSSPKATIHAYEVQMDVYTLLLEKNGYKTRGVAYLVYYFPLEANDNGFNFAIESKVLKTDPARARKLFGEAVSILKNDVAPTASPKCEYCGREAKLNEDHGK